MNPPLPEFHERGTICVIVLCVAHTRNVPKQWTLIAAAATLYWEDVPVLPYSRCCYKNI